MHRIDGYGATSDNKFTDENPATGTAATVVTDDFMNAVQEEIAAVIEGAGIELNKLQNDQLLTAISTLIADGISGGSGSYVTLTGDQTIEDIKTFSSSPAVPTPDAGDSSSNAAPTAFVQSAIVAPFTTGQSLAANGSQSLPGGLILKWGVYTGVLTVTPFVTPTPTSITFVSPFPTECFNVQMTAMDPSNDITADSWPALVSYSASGFTMVPQNTGNSGSSYDLNGFMWFCIGH